MPALKPYFPLGATYSEGVQELPELEAFLATLQAFAQDLSTELVEIAAPYKLERLECLLKLLARATDAGRPWTRGFFVSSFFCQLKAAKNVLIDHNEQTIAPESWKIFLDSGVRAYSVYQRYRFILEKRPNWYYGDGRRIFTASILEFLRLLRETTERTPNQALVSTELEKFAELLPFEIGIRRSTLKKIFEPLSRRILRVSTCASESRNITPTNLARLERSFKLWADTQEALEERFLNNHDLPERLFLAQARIETLMDQAPFRGLRFDSNGELVLKENLSIAPALEGRAAFEDLSPKNWLDIVSYSLMNGYRDDEDRKRPRSASSTLDRKGPCSFWKIGETCLPI